MGTHNYYASEGLRAFGLSNNVISFAEMMETKEEKKDTAFCYSRKCAGGNGIIGVEKDVRKTFSNCPDCKHALVWKYE